MLQFVLRRFIQVIPILLGVTLVTFALVQIMPGSIADMLVPPSAPQSLKDEINRIVGKVKDSGVTLVPLALYFHDGYAKVEIAVARGRKNYDKRQAIAERESKREAERATGRRTKGID